VTAIECSNASGWALPPCVILKAKSLLKHSLIVFRRTGGLKLVLTVGLQIKLDFVGLRNSLFRLLLYGLRGFTGF
jgi:hypothetical protein